MADEWIDAGRAAERLGVKTATLYAYVSRGVLRRRRSPDGRRSLFDPAEVEELARRGRPRRSPTLPVIESRITVLEDGRPYYRGRDALALAGAEGFEDVAHWLWTGEWDGDREPWRAVPEAVRVARAAQSGLPEGTLPLERLQVITVALATADPLRLTLDPAAVVGAGRNLVAGMVDALPGVAADGTSIADRLWTRLTGTAPDAAPAAALRSALVLLADHELAASTLAARVAASVRADPYAVVSTGLGVLGGALHGGESLAVETLLAEIAEPGDAARVIGGRLRRGDRLPGFGHGVHRAGDARAPHLFDRVRAAADGHPRLAVAEAALADARSRRLPAMNLDFALATLTAVSGMPRGAGEAVFAVARTAGWLAHALEEYARDVPIRPRAVHP